MKKLKLNKNFEVILRLLTSGRSAFSPSNIIHSMSTNKMLKFLVIQKIKIGLQSFTPKSLKYLANNSQYLYVEFAALFWNDTTNVKNIKLFNIKTNTK